MTALRLSSVRAGHGRGPDVLHDLDLEIAEGERVGVVGPSGCGKTTLGRVVLGLLPRRGGELEVCGVAVAPRPRGRAPWAPVQAVLQEADAHLDPWRTAAQMLRRSAAVHGHAPPDAAAREALESVGLAHRAHERPATLSGGERRRLGVARISLARPRLIVADEPTAGVDAPRRDGLLRLLLEPPGRPRPAALLVSHDLGRLARWCDRLVVLDAGRVVERLAAGALGRAAHPRTRALLAALPAAERP